MLRRVSITADADCLLSITLTNLTHIPHPGHPASYYVDQAGPSICIGNVSAVQQIASYDRLDPSINYLGRSHEAAHDYK